MFKYLLAMVIGLLFGLLMAGLILLVAQQPRGHAVLLLPTYTTEPLVVQVDGAVANPGIYELSPGSRMEAALAAAGDPLPDADPSRMNLAEQLRDGQKITVPTRGTPPVVSSAGESEYSIEPTSTVVEIVNINTADEKLLETLPGIGPAKAKQICDYRQEHGFFDKIEDLMDVPGIGPATFEMLKSQITL